MLSVNMFQPYYVKEEPDRIRIVLAYQYFSLWLDGQVYQFVPLESRKIEVNRTTLKVLNQKAIFVFQKGTKYKSIALAELLQIPDFDQRVQTIIYPYVKEDKNNYFFNEVNDIILALEKQNMKRLIDNALDKKDIGQFMKYSTQLNNM
ncbi:hypothetical protein BN1058_00642 [Paraliobacillus sp. PM-2]|uniref:IDEAL domain-containing protein n=1 Tax=Paraliobacillus sp. PM-2 TaxID=1462524 RepID=UPI00061C6CCD|nr:IDEAL domain-containing protein [Paraliobacillus sp. PM-2]CQR46384.1 hypothetical protein BN1058_00642 [Paraliobacillus sp. PM-2]